MQLKARMAKQKQISSRIHVESVTLKKAARKKAGFLKCKDCKESILKDLYFTMFCF